jgi:hypothetical protein
LGSLGKKYAFFESSSTKQEGIKEICNHAIKMILEIRGVESYIDKQTNDNCCTLI